MRNHIVGMEFSISEANGASKLPLFCLHFLCFCSRGRKDTPSHIKLLISVKITETSWKLCVFMKFIYRSPNGCPFPRGLQNHGKHKQNKGILDAPLTSKMLNSTARGWILMVFFHSHESGRDS